MDSNPFTPTSLPSTTVYNPSPSKPSQNQKLKYIYKKKISYRENSNMLKTEDEYREGGGNGWAAGICEACERCPAEFICKADAASLCAACDAEIHSANPLARRHQRVPISSGGAMFRSVEEEDEEEAASWLLMNPGKNNNDNKNNNSNNNGMFLLGGEDEDEEEDDDYLKFVEFNGNNEEDDEFERLKNNNYGGGGDSVVPIDQFEGNKDHHHHLHHHLHHHHEQQQQNHEILLEQSYGGLVDASEFFHTSSKPSYSYNGFLTHAVTLFLLNSLIILLFL